MGDKSGKTTQRRGLNKNDRYGKNRRRVLQSLAMGGTAITVKNIPEKWARPVLDTTMLPAHARGSNPETPCVVESLTCVLGSVTGVPFTATFSQDTPLNGSPAPGNTLTINPTRTPSDEPTSIVFRSLAATLTPECPQPITLLVSENYGGTEFDLDAGNFAQTVAPVNGTASFDNIVAAVDRGYDTNGSVGVAATVDFTFRTDNLPDCVINVVFLEN